MTIRKTVISVKISNNRIAISKNRTSEFMLPMVKKNQKNVPEKNRTKMIIMII